MPILECLTSDPAGAVPLHFVPEAGAEGWIAGRAPFERRWLEATGYKAKVGQTALLPADDGSLAAALHVTDAANLWDVAAARANLPAGVWRLADGGIDPIEAALGWALASYRFDRYRKASDEPGPILVLDAGAIEAATPLAEAIAFGRDLVNTPASDLGPGELVELITAEAGRCGAKATVIEGADLEEGYPAIHAVGKAASRAPRLLDLTWGDPTAPKLTLVGKGVCFDTGGLDLKPASGMALMKKDMGGAAAMAALALAVMAAGLKVRLRLLVPAVENSVSANSFRPGDVVMSRKGPTIEVGNTDAEGRVILADALALAYEEDPDLVIDAATLTGAARVALGPELPVLFTPQDGVAGGMLEAGEATHEPLWRLPLHAPYKAYIKSRVADLNNAGQKPFAGAITAALFLEAFTGDGDWAHIDLFGWNDEGRPGRPRGGEAMAVRPLLAYLRRRYDR